MTTIICSLCKKPVDKVVTTLQHHTDSILVSVSCHGQWDHTTLCNLFIFEHGHLLSDATGYAFTSQHSTGTTLVPSWHRQDS